MSSSVVAIARKHVLALTSTSAFIRLAMATHDRTATFRLEGAIAARTPEAGQRTGQALQNICRVRSPCLPGLRTLLSHTAPSCLALFSGRCFLRLARFPFTP